MAGLKKESKKIKRDAGVLKNFAEQLSKQPGFKMFSKPKTRLPGGKKAPR